MGYRFIQGGGQVHIRKANVPKLVSTCMKDDDFVRALKAQDVKAEDVTTLEHLYEVLDMSFTTCQDGNDPTFPTAEQGDVVSVHFHDDTWCGLFDDFLHAVAPLVEEGIVYFTGEDGQAWGCVFVNGLCAPADFHTMLLEYLGDNEAVK